MPLWSRTPLLIALLGVLALGLAVLSDSLWIAAAASLVLLAFGFGLSMRHAPRRPAAATAAPRAASDFPRGLLEGMHDPIIVLDAGLRVMLANRAAETVLGAACERKHLSAVLRNPDVLEAVQRVKNGGDDEQVFFDFLVPVRRHYEAVIGSFVSEGGDHLVLVQLRDLTAMRRAEEMRADFIANASHELRTPLAAVSGFIDTLRGHAKDDTKARERFLEIMSVETGRMRRLIDDLLSLTRIELNEHNPPAERVDLVAVVRDAAAALVPLADADGINFDIPAHPPLMVVGARDELTQVFQNLMHNAIKYGRERGMVQIRFGHDADESGRVFVAVADQGEGIPREAIPRLTERFYRVDIKRSRERGGTGLGLAIVKHILNRHRGRLQIESTPGEGSVFTVQLPFAPEA